MKKLIPAVLLALLFVNTDVFANQTNTSQVPADSTLNQPFSVLSKSKGIEDVKIRKSKKAGSIVYVTIGIPQRKTSDNNVTGMGISGKSQSQELRNQAGPVFDHIDVLNGGYEDIKVDKLNTTQNIYTIKNVNFPLRLKMKAGAELIEFELKEQGRWDVDIIYKNN